MSPSVRRIRMRGPAGRSSSRLGYGYLNVDAAMDAARRLAGGSAARPQATHSLAERVEGFVEQAGAAPSLREHVGREDVLDDLWSRETGEEQPGGERLASDPAEVTEAAGKRPGPEGPQGERIEELLVCPYDGEGFDARAVLEKLEPFRQSSL